MNPSGKALAGEDSSANEEPLKEETGESTRDGNASGNNTSDESSPDDSSASDSTRAVECVNCGHEFTGNYCPKCGQESDPSTSVTGVIGGFIREFIDLESGLWPTLTGLTLRPGEVLRRYLGGVRTGLIGPGRYLLAAAVVDYGTARFLVWSGAAESPLDSDSFSGGAMTAEKTGKVLEVTLDQMSTLSARSEASAMSALLLTGLLAVLLYRLFESKLEQVGEAVAIGSYLTAHAVFLALGAELLYLPPAALYAGEPVEPGLFINTSTFVGYVGFASYRGFGPGWKPALKGIFAGTWTIVELLSVVFAAMMTYATALVFAYPERYVPAGETTWAVGAAFAFIALFGAIPLLLHAGAELYYRLR